MRKYRFADTAENRKKQRDIQFLSDVKDDYRKDLMERIYNMNIKDMRFDKERKILYGTKLSYMNMIYVRKIMVHNNETKNSKLFTFVEYNDGDYIFKNEDLLLYLK